MYRTRSSSANGFYTMNAAITELVNAFNDL